jgi:hypothetical protein
MKAMTWVIDDPDHPYRRIRWISEGLDNNLLVHCYLYDKDDNNMGEIKFQPWDENPKLGKGGADWKVGALVSPKNIPSGNYRIKLEVTGSSVSGRSYFFTIKNPASLYRKSFKSRSFINTKQPGLNENWFLGSTREIRWTTVTSTIHQLNMELLKDGESVGDIVKNLFNKGMYPWKVGHVLGGQKFSGVKFTIRFTNAQGKYLGESLPFNIIALQGGAKLKKKD